MTLCITFARYFTVSACFCVVGLPLAQALPALQLGPDGSAGWSWDGASETWVLSGSGSLRAYANEDASVGKYAWDSAGAANQYAYLVVAAEPQVNLDAFEIQVFNDGSLLSLFDSGYGNPPLEDPNSLSPHGIYDTWFEIYQFAFDGPLMNISNTQPGSTGTGTGFMEEFNISILSTIPGLHGLHIDLFTVIGDGIYIPVPGGDIDKSLVKTFAPFSHDAEISATLSVPEAGTTLGYSSMVGLIMGLGLVRRRRIR